MPSPLTQLNIALSGGSKPEDFLSPDQRLDAIADILAEITLDALNKSNSQQQ